MCAERGEGPSLLVGLEHSFPLGHCSLENSCWNTTHSSNSCTSRWLEKSKKELLLAEICFTMKCFAWRRGRRGRAWCEVRLRPTLVLQRNLITPSSSWWGLATFAGPARLPLEGQGPAAPEHGLELLLGCKSCICWNNGSTEVKSFWD